MKLFIVSALIVLLSVSSYAAKPALLGSLCLNTVNCFVDPCRVSRCDAHPGANCVSNYCGGCNAFWYLDGKRVDCSHSIPARAIETPSTKCVTVNCFLDPCGLAKCDKHPEAICRANYCGGCNAWFYVQGKRVLCN